MDPIEILLARLYEAARELPFPEFQEAALSELARAVHVDLAANGDAHVDLTQLTKAERAVAAHISQGLSYKDAARALGITPATVRNQLHAVYAKLGVHSKAELFNRVASRHP